MKNKIPAMKNASNVARGNHVEKVLAEMLRADGFIVDKRPRVKYQSLDFFGLFDLVAITPNGDQLWYIQAKRNSIREPLKTRQKILGLHMPDCCHKWIVIWRDKTSDWVVEHLVEENGHWYSLKSRFETENLIYEMIEKTH